MIYILFVFASCLGQQKWKGREFIEIGNLCVCFKYTRQNFIKYVAKDICFTPLSKSCFCLLIIIPLFLDGEHLFSPPKKKLKQGMVS